MPRYARKVLVVLICTVALLCLTVMRASTQRRARRANGARNFKRFRPDYSTRKAVAPSGDPLADEIMLNIDWQTGVHNCGDLGWNHMPYQDSCIHPADQFSPHWEQKGISPNSSLAWAVHYALQNDPAHKWRAVAYLTIGHFGDPIGNTVVELFNKNKGKTYDVLVHNYVAAFEHDDPDTYGGRGQGFKVGVTYSGDDAFEDCLGLHDITSLDIPPGLAVELTVLRPHFQFATKTFGPGHILLDGEFNDMPIWKLTVIRK